MLTRPFIFFLTLLLALGFASTASAQYSPPQRQVVLKITEAQGSSEPPCDQNDFWLDVTLDGSTSDFELDQLYAHKRGEAPGCRAVILERESISGIDKSRTQDVCMGNVNDVEMDFTISLIERDWPDEDDQEARYNGTVNFNDPSTHEGCYYPGGGEGGFCWEFDILDESKADSDGDGIRDYFETYGLDVDCNGQLDAGVDLLFHQMGLSPTHKDLLLEVNWFEGYRPTTAVFDELKAVFAAAPLGAGGVDNPDTQLGINVHVDAGEVMNDVGLHSIGGRNFGSAVNSPGSREELDAFMLLAEDAKRIGFFRQVILGPLIDDGLPTEHAAGRFIGNDRIQMENLSASTFIHEFGHALGILHGGEKRDDGTLNAAVFGSAGHNCKPNHISVMNYFYSASGIPFQTGGVTKFFNDFSPSKIPDAEIVISAVAATTCPAGSFGCNRRIGLLPDLDEPHLNETEPLMMDSAENGILVRHQMIHSDGTGAVVTTPLWDPVDWDGDPLTNLTDVAINIDVDDTRAGPQGCSAERNGGPSSMRNYDEWSRMDLPPGRGVEGNLENPNIGWEDEHAPFTEEAIAQARDAVTATDLSLAASLSPEVISTQSSATLTIDVANAGPNTASGGEVSIFLPPGVTVTEAPGACDLVSASLVRCRTARQRSAEIIGLPPYASVGFVLTLDVDRNLSGASRKIIVVAGLAARDLDFSDNSQILDVVTEPSFFGFDDLARPWVTSYGNGTPIPTTLSNYDDGTSAAVFDCGSVQVESPTFDTAEVELIGSQIMMNLWVPEQQNPWWAGEVKLLLDIPSAGIRNQWVGGAGLTNLTRDEWTPVMFDFPPNLQDALFGDHPDARFRIEMNVATCGAPVLLDNLQFIGDLAVRTTYHPSDYAIVTSSSVLSFEQVEDWHFSQGAGSAAYDTVRVAEGTGSLSVNPGNWSRVQSRIFSTEELRSVTSKLSFEVFIPDLPADYYWFGQMNAFLTCPSAGLWNQYLGHQPLQILFDNEFNRVEFELSPEVLSVLQSSHDDCSFALEFTSQQSYGPLSVDGGGFVQ